MPHYKDGTEAKVGDIVRGHGYNVKHEIIGKLIDIRSGPTCNVTIAHVGLKAECYLVAYADRELGAYTPAAAVRRVDAEFEYGQADAFEKVA